MNAHLDVRAGTGVHFENQNTAFTCTVLVLIKSHTLETSFRYDFRNRVLSLAAARRASGARRAERARGVVFRVPTRVSPRVAM